MYSDDETNELAGFFPLGESDLKSTRWIQGLNSTIFTSILGVEMIQFDELAAYFFMMGWLIQPPTVG